MEAVAAAAGVRPLVVGKPEPPLFELALSRMGLTAEDAAMVGDSVDSDVRGARRVGMTAILFAPTAAPTAWPTTWSSSMAAAPAAARPTADARPPPLGRPARAGGPRRDRRVSRPAARASPSSPPPTSTTRRAYFERVRAALAPAPPDGAGLELVHLRWDARPLADAGRARTRVFMGGGNTYALLKRLRGAGLLAAIRARVLAGMPYVGRERGLERGGADHPHHE